VEHDRARTALLGSYPVEPSREGTVMKVEDLPANADRCVCPTCPTYNDCMQDAGQRMFCSRGVTECGPKPMSCVCGTCPVWSQYTLKDYYYCIEGAAS
jgi:hypothetical protein